MCAPSDWLADKLTVLLTEPVIQPCNTHTGWLTNHNKVQCSRINRYKCRRSVAMELPTLKPTDTSHVAAITEKMRCYKPVKA